MSGDGRDRADDKARRSGIKLPDGEELNHERPEPLHGAKGLPVSPNGDGAEPHKVGVDG